MFMYSFEEFKMNVNDVPQYHELHDHIRRLLKDEPEKFVYFSNKENFKIRNHHIPCVAISLDDTDETMVSVHVMQWYKAKNKIYSFLEYRFPDNLYINYDLRETASIFSEQAIWSTRLFLPLVLDSVFGGVPCFGNSLEERK